jgi:hypothetical protein
MVELFRSRFPLSQHESRIPAFLLNPYSFRELIAKSDLKSAVSDQLSAYSYPQPQILDRPSQIRHSFPPALKKK